MEQTHNTPKNIKIFIFLHAVLLLYSLCSVCSKFASQHEFLSLWFILFYGVTLLGLFVYALLWQQVLKRLPLTIAFANKSIVIIWGILWGALLFQEAITWNMIVGALIIGVGIYLVGSCDE